MEMIRQLIAANLFEGVSSFLSFIASTFIGGDFLQRSPTVWSKRKILVKGRVLEDKEPVL